ncbi:Hypothetical protein FKW44_002187 [Caligus rogercresseyi]|uniref:Uncharacterized protein n=1 Tax=Caligus rogercresseyi TaxID=217165 RepID=A0A7T8QW52_CALRO|nr:Hypothetical protein FKW44_002187 [Caligus rogercresseyi]
MTEGGFCLLKRVLSCTGCLPFFKIKPVILTVVGGLDRENLCLRKRFLPVLPPP